MDWKTTPMDQAERRNKSQKKMARQRVRWKTEMPQDYCDKTLALLQATTMKNPRMAVTLLYLWMDKHIKNWFRRWYSHNIFPLTTPITSAPENHSGIIELLRDVQIRLQNAEDIQPVSTEQRKTDQKTKIWDWLTPTHQHIILERSESASINILSAPT